MNKKKYIGIDIGGTAVKIGSVDEDGTIHATETYAVNFDGYETPILQTVVKSCHNFLEKYRENASEYAGIGVSATGAISTKKLDQQPDSTGDGAGIPYSDRSA